MRESQVNAGNGGKPAESIITTSSELAELCGQLNSCARFGMDTEFVGEDSYHPHLCLIQIATADSLFLIDPFTAGSLDEFWQTVADPNNLVILHAAREEMRLCRLLGEVAPANQFDLQVAAGLAGFHYPLSHDKLVRQILGRQMSKAETRTEWRTRPLSPEQIRYAFDDVRYLLPLWEKLSSRLDKLERSSWAKEEFERMVDSSQLGSENTQPTAAKWRKLRGASALDERRLAIVRELYQWREQVAARLNRPARTVVRDDLLVEIARRKPDSSAGLGRIRGLPKRYLQPILELVQETIRLPRNKLPQPAATHKDPGQLGLAVHLATAFLGDLCVKNQLAPSLVANQQEIKQVVRHCMQGSPIPDGNLLGQGWRSQIVLPELTALLRGERFLYVHDLNQTAPFGIQTRDAN